MAWLACNNDGEEFIFEHKPYRRFYVEWIDLFDGTPHKEEVKYWQTNHEWESCLSLPKGSIKKLIGRELTWDDEPVEI